jgi:tetratricopeptide (TPR) repeat protein
LDPTYADSYSNRGLAHHNLGQYEQAIQDLDQAIRLEATVAVAKAYYNRGLAHQSLGNSKEAERDLQKGKELFMRG